MGHDGVPGNRAVRKSSTCAKLHSLHRSGRDGVHFRPPTQWKYMADYMVKSAFLLSNCRTGGAAPGAARANLMSFTLTALKHFACKEAERAAHAAMDPLLSRSKLSTPPLPEPFFPRHQAASPLALALLGDVPKGSLLMRTSLYVPICIRLLRMCAQYREVVRGALPREVRRVRAYSLPIYIRAFILEHVIGVHILSIRVCMVSESLVNPSWSLVASVHSVYASFFLVSFSTSSTQLKSPPMRVS